MIHSSKEKSHAAHTGDKRFDYGDLKLWIINILIRIQIHVVGSVQGQEKVKFI